MLTTCIWIHVVNSVARPNQNQLLVQTTLSLDVKMEETVAAGASAAFIKYNSCECPQTKKKMVAERVFKKWNKSWR